MSTDASNQSGPQKSVSRKMLEDAAALTLRVLDKTTTPDDIADLIITLPANAVPKEKWNSYVMRNVKLPPDCETYVDGQTTFTREELDALEDRIAAYYGVEEPFYINAESSPITRSLSFQSLETRSASSLSAVPVERFTHLPEASS
jgi:hypothetical protein